MTPPISILVADDDPDLRDILRSILEPKGFEVLEVSDGRAALDAVRRQHPHLVILDYMMPHLDGPGVCRALKDDLLLRHTPIIMLTGKSEIQDKVSGMDAGADDYLVKPFEPEELLARVRMVLRRTSQELEANPLTKLPGNISIQRELEMRLASQQPLAVCYCDLNRFKAFNDHYGFERGDQAIAYTVQILLSAVKTHGNPTDFLGHIGGDDFVIITTPDRAETICGAIIKTFDETITCLYDEEDRRQGYLLHTDRTGQAVKLGFLSIGIAIVTNTDQTLLHPGHIAKLGAELKILAKRVEKSAYVKERRKPPTSSAG